MANISPEMFDSFANEMSFNDPQKMRVMDQLAKVMFGKPLSKMGSMSQAVMRMLGHGVMNTYGNALGIDDNGQNFALIHQSIAGMSGGGLNLVDQSGKAMKGPGMGPGASTLMAAKAMTEELDSAMYSKGGVAQNHITGGMNRGMLAAMQAQYIREAGGLQQGDVIVGKNFEPGAKGIREGMKQMQEQGVDANSSQMRALAKAARATEIRNEELSKDEYKEMREDLAEKNRQLTTLEKIKNAGGGKDYEKEYGISLDDAISEQREAVTTARSKLDSTVNSKLKGKKIKAGKVGDTEVDAFEYDEETMALVNDVDKGALAATGINKEVGEKWKEALSKTKDNVKELSKIFGTDNFQELQSLAKNLNMGSLTNKNNAADVAKRIRNAKVEAEKTGRSVSEVFEEQASILETIKGTSGYTASAATVERMQAQRASNQRAIEMGATNLSAEEMDAQMLANNNIVVSEHGRAISANYLLDEAKKSKDPKMQEQVATLEKLRDAYMNETDPGKRKKLEQQYVTAAKETFGNDRLNDEVVRKKALEGGFGDQIIAGESETVARGQDATKFVNDVKKAKNKAERYREKYGDDWEQKVKKQVGDVAATIGGDYETFGELVNAGKSKRAALDAVLDSPKMKKEDAEAIRKIEGENASLEEKIATETNEDKKKELQEQKKANDEKIKGISSEYAAEKEKQDAKIQKKKDSIRQELEDSKKYTKEQIDEYMGAYDTIIRKAGSSDFTDQEMIDQMQRHIEKSKAAGGSMGKRAEARQETARRDAFINSISESGNNTLNKDGMQGLMKNLITGGKEVNEDTAMANWLQDTENSGISYDRTTGNAKVDVDKINANEEANVIALKAERSESENKDLAKNKKVQNMLGVESEEEALEILQNPEKLTETMMKHKDNGGYVQMIGEGENAQYIMAGQDEVTKQASNLTEKLDSTSEFGKYLKGMKLDDVQIDKEKGITKMVIGDQTYTKPEDIEKAFISQAAQNKEMQANLQQLSESSDPQTAKKAKEYLEQVRNTQELSMYTNEGDEDKSIGEIMDNMSKWHMFGSDDKFDVQYDDLDEEDKQKYGSKSAYNMKKAVAKSKYDAMRRLAKNDKGQKQLEEAAKELGIEYDGGKEGFMKLKAKDMERIAAKVGEKNEKFKEDYNSMDFLKEGTNLLNSGKVGKDGMVKLQDGSGNDMSFNVFDPSVMRELGKQAEAMGGEPFDESKLQSQYIANMAQSMAALKECIENGILKVKKM